MKWFICQARQYVLRQNTYFFKFTIQRVFSQIFFKTTLSALPRQMTSADPQPRSTNSLYWVPIQGWAIWMLLSYLIMFLFTSIKIWSGFAVASFSFFLCFPVLVFFGHWLCSARLRLRGDNNNTGHRRCNCQSLSPNKVASLVQRLHYLFRASLHSCCRNAAFLSFSSEGQKLARLK